MTDYDLIAEEKNSYYTIQIYKTKHDSDYFGKPSSFKANIIWNLYNYSAIEGKIEFSAHGDNLIELSICIIRNASQINMKMADALYWKISNVLARAYKVVNEN